MSRRQPGDTSTLEQNVLACCLSAMGLAVATSILTGDLRRLVVRVGRRWAQ